MTSLAQARRALAEQFRAAGLDTPDLDARILIGHALGLGHAGLIAAAAQPVADEKAACIAAFARRRLAGEPVARIVGEKEFWGLRLIVTPAVLVPRPDTETIVACALELLDRDGARTRPLRIADLATGSGAILLALLSELPNARGTGTDISAQALDVARRNAARLGLNERTQFIIGDYGTALAAPFDLVVSNPPYIASATIPALDREVREHDPHLALDGGADGLTAYRAIATDAPRLLGSSGHLVVEIGQGQAGDVAALFRQQGLAVDAPRPDLAGMPRALAARSP